MACNECGQTRLQKIGGYLSRCLTLSSEAADHGTDTASLTRLLLSAKEMTPETARAAPSAQKPAKVVIPKEPRVIPDIAGIGLRQKAIIDAAREFVSGKIDGETLIARLTSLSKSPPQSQPPSPAPSSGA